MMLLGIELTWGLVGYAFASLGLYMVPSLIMMLWNKTITAWAARGGCLMQIINFVVAMCFTAYMFYLCNVVLFQWFGSVYLAR